MRKLLFLFFLGAVIIADAQTIALYKNGSIINTYSLQEIDSIVFNKQSQEEQKYVDLGLPSGTLWATCNLGATEPEQYGDYFAWGETKPQSNNVYAWSSYKWCEGSASTITKYCTNNNYGKIDNIEELVAEDDAASSVLGTKWQMPSKAQFEELINSEYTTVTWTTQNEVNGLLVISKTNGKKIFLPASGYRYNSKYDSSGTEISYWSRSLHFASYNAYNLIYNGTYIGTDIRVDGCSRCAGHSIRPVIQPEPTIVPVTSITLDKDTMLMEKEKYLYLTPTVLPENATDKSLVWTSSNENVAAVSSTGIVTALNGGKATITCTASDGSGIAATCDVFVIENDEYVDLGLPSGTLWATKNIGAQVPEDYGSYYAWGEVEPKTSYSWANYSWCNGTDNTITKYCYNDTQGTVDNKAELESEDDAATCCCGGEWQIPSLEQIDELYNGSYTTKTWTSLNGVYGNLITSNANGNSIFLPAAGYEDGSDIKGTASIGRYWSRTHRVMLASTAYDLYVSSSEYSFRYNADSRYYGQSIRPVITNHE